MDDGAMVRRSEAALRHHARLLADQPGVRLMDGNRVDLLVDGPALAAALCEAVAAARDHVHVESYIFEPGGPGEQLAARLEQACARGVRVNLLYDDLGSFGTPASFFARLQAAGVTTCAYNPLRRWQQPLGRLINERDHRKIAIVDGRIAFIGGMNISSVYASGSMRSVGSRRRAQERAAEARAARAQAHEDRAAGREPDVHHGWRDTHLRVEGPVVVQLQKEFLRQWHRQTGALPMRARWFPRPSQPVSLPGTQRAALLASHAGRRRNPIYRALLCAIAEAQQRVLVTVAYFVPPRRLRRALMDAARRGVDVRLIVPAFTDAWPTLAAGRRHYGRLLAAGVRVVEHDKALLHAKTVVIDGVWSTVGSFNLDWRSIVHNAEANLLVLDAGMGADLEALFAKDEERSHPLTLARWQQRGWLARLQEWLAARFQYLL